MCVCYCDIPAGCVCTGASRCAHVCTCGDLCQHLRWGSSAGDSCVQGKTKMDSRMWNLNPAAGGIHPIHMHIFRDIYNYYWWTSKLVSQRGEDHEAIGAVCVGVSTEHCCLC